MKRLDSKAAGAVLHFIANINTEIHLLNQNVIQFIKLKTYTDERKTEQKPTRYIHYRNVHYSYKLAVDKKKEQVLQKSILKIW